MVIKLKEPPSSDKEVDTCFLDDELYVTLSEAESEMSLADDLEAASDARNWIPLTDNHCCHSHTHRGEDIVCIRLSIRYKRYLPLSNSKTTALPRLFWLVYFKYNMPVPYCVRA